MRIHIIGGSGSGKTYLSNKLKKEYGFNQLDLDKIEWVNVNGKTVKRNLDKKKKLLKEKLEDNLIVEGVYFDWCKESFMKSDYIFYLNVPLLKQEYRIIKRSIKRKLGIEKCFFKETFKSITDLLKWNIKYNTEFKDDIKSTLDKYQDKVYNVNSYKEIKKIIEGDLKMRDKSKDLSMMVSDVKFNYRAGLLIEKGNKVLVECNPELDFVTLPGGKVQTLESSAEALKRELLEEMNVKLDIKKLKMRALIENFFPMDGKNYHELYFLYKYKVTTKDNPFDKVSKNMDSKASYYKWVKKDELDKANLLPVVLRKIALTSKFENIVVNDLKKFTK